MSLSRGVSARRERAAEDMRREGDRNALYDEVWCVIDVDRHARLRQACQRAEQAGIHMAVSNPCFELWLLLHFAAHTAPVANSRDLEKEVRKHLPRYDKHVECAELEESYEIARHRARGLEKMHLADGHKNGNPSTDVWKLVDSLKRNKNP